MGLGEGTSKPVLARYWLTPGAVLVAAIFLLNVYRAAVQSVTYDEAYSYTAYASNGWSNIFHSYIANNHVLHSTLIKLAHDFVGTSQLVLRMPGLLGGLLFLINSLRLARLLLPRNPLAATLAFLALTINPLVLDYLSMARGYGLALAFFSWAVLEALSLINESQPSVRRFLHLGLFLGLSVAANLTFLFPWAALCVAMALLFYVKGHARRCWVRNIVQLAAGCAAGALVAAAFLWMPLQHASRAQFYQGSPTLRSSMLSLIGPSLQHRATLWGGLSPEPFLWAWYAAAVLFPLATVGALAVAWKLWRTPDALDQPRCHFLLLQVTAALTVGLLVAAHWGARVLYPEARTGLYLVFTCTLAAVSLAPFALQPTRPYVRYAAAIVGLLLVGRFVSQISVSYYANWRYDASTRRAFDAVREMSRMHRGQPSRIRYSWELGPSLEFYRRGANDGSVVLLDSIAGRRMSVFTGADIYILDDEDRPRAVAAGLVPVRYFDISETTIAVPKQP